MEQKHKRNTELEPQLRLDLCLGKAVNRTIRKSSVPHRCNENVIRRLTLHRRLRRTWIALAAVACVAAISVVPYVLLTNENTERHHTYRPLAHASTDIYEAASRQIETEVKEVTSEPEQQPQTIQTAPMAEHRQAEKAMQTAHSTMSQTEEEPENTADMQAASTAVASLSGEYRHPSPTMADFIEQKASQHIMHSRQLECVTGDGEHSTVNIHVFPYDNNYEIMKWLTQVAHMFHEQTPQSQLRILDEGQLLLKLTNHSNETEIWMAEHHNGSVYIYHSCNEPQAFASPCFLEFLERRTS